MLESDDSPALPTIPVQERRPSRPTLTIRTVNRRLGTPLVAVIDLARPEYVHSICQRSW